MVNREDGVHFKSLKKDFFNMRTNIPRRFYIFIVLPSLLYSFALTFPAQKVFAAIQ